MIIDGEYRGYKYQIKPRTPFPGIGWYIAVYNHNGMPVVVESPGAFYDGAEDHPEGAYAWAETAVKKHIDKAIALRSA
jgi:hypothetical protein